LALALTGCQETPIAPSTRTLRPADARLSSSLQPTAAGLDRSQLALPSSYRLTDQAFAEAARRAIDPNDYVCPPSTPVVDWWVGKAIEFAKAEPDLFKVVYTNFLGDLVVTFESLLFQTNKTPQYFGYDGRYTKTLLKAERDVKRFWDIKSDDIQLLGMHGTVLLDVERTAATYQVAFGVPRATALVIANMVKDAVAKSKILNGGNHPLFSFNAFAFSEADVPEEEKFGIPDKIVMGDGILDGFGALGFDDVAPQAIFAHEFAHHIQFENGYFNDLDDQPKLTGAERTRYTELMADAMAAYYLTHKRGGTLNKHRVAQFLEVFFQIGDCAFTNPGHHGTPNQRMRAAQFGFEVADEAHKQGHILTSEQFHELFEAAYPELIAPDAP
jgi:hypothetical protein